MKTPATTGTMERCDSTAGCMAGGQAGIARTRLFGLAGALEGVVDQAHTFDVPFQFADGGADHAEINFVALLDVAGEQAFVADGVDQAGDAGAVAVDAPDGRAR